MRVATVHGPGELRLEEVAELEPGPGDVRIKVAAAGICGTDLHFRQMGSRHGRPMPLGHEFAGEVVQVGTDVVSFEPGDRVAYNSYNSPADVGRGGECGGFSDHVIIRDVEGHVQSLCRVPPELDLQYAALVEPISVGTHAVNRAQVETGDSITLFGAGPIGLGVIMALRWRGIEDITVFELSPLRRQRALALGARHALDPRVDRPEEALGKLRGHSSLWGRRYPKTGVYIEASGAAGLLAQVAEFCAKGSRIITLAVHRQPVTLDGTRVMSKEISLIGSSGYDQEYPQVMDKLASGAAETELMISHRFGFSAFMEAFETANSPDLAAKVLLEFE